MMMMSENKSTVPFLSPSFVYPRIAPPSSRTVVVVIVYRWCSTVVRRTSFKESSSSFASSPLLCLWRFFHFFHSPKIRAIDLFGIFLMSIFSRQNLHHFFGPFVCARDEIFLIFLLLLSSFFLSLRDLFFLFFFFLGRFVSLTLSLSL